jgi:insertion element IS1 protein InsB
MRKLAHLDIKHYYTDNWKSYKKHIPPEKHTVTKKKTQKIERQNLNFRTHIKRLARKTICFSKKDDMHYGMMKAYIWHKNAA